MPTGQVTNIVEASTADLVQPPKGMRRYETLLLIRPDAPAEQRFALPFHYPFLRFAEALH